MTNVPSVEDLFFGRTDLDRPRTESLVTEALRGCDDGELVLE